MVQVASFGIFPKSASRLVPDGWVELNRFGYRYDFRAFQLELDILGTQNFGNRPVVEELRPFEVGVISKNPEIPRLCIEIARKSCYFCPNTKKN